LYSYSLEAYIAGQTSTSPDKLVILKSSRMVGIMQRVVTGLVLCAGVLGSVDAGNIMNHFVNVKRDAIDGECGIGNFGGVFSSTSFPGKSN
jgi:hypothetical protein